MCIFYLYYNDHCLVSTVHLPVPPPSPDPTLTFTNVTRVLESVRDVDRLSGVLNVPLSVRDKIRRDYATSEQQRKAMVRYGLQSTPSFSWNMLSGWLYYWEETTALEAAKQYIQNPTGMLP